MGRPGQCLYGSLVFKESTDRSVLVSIPDKKFIVIASAGELLVIKGPLESTDFLCVFLESADGLMGADVEERDCFVSTASGQNITTVESQG